MNYSTTFWLCLKPAKRGYRDLGARLVQKSPALDVGEIAIELNVTVPRALFQRPALRAKVVVPDDASPPVINAEVTDNIAAVLREQLGLRVEVSVGAEGAQ